MAIEVKHGANPSALIYSRFAGAEGKAARGAMDKFLQASQRQQLQRRDHDFRAYEMAENQGFRLYQQDREHVQQMQRLGAVQRGRSRDRARYQQDRRELIDYKFTAEQKDRQNRIRQALSTLDYDESLSPEDREEAKRELMYQWSGMQAPPSKEDPSPYAPGQGVGEYWYDEGYGGYLTRTEKGIQEMNGLSQDKALEMAINMNSPDEGETNWANVQRDFQRIRQMGGGPGGGQPQLAGGAGGVPELNNPAAEGDPRVQQMQSRLVKIESDISDAEFALKKHRESPAARMGSGSGVKANPRSMAGRKHRKDKSDWEEKEEKLTKRIEEEQRKRQLVLANIKGMSDTSDILADVRP